MNQNEEEKIMSVCPQCGTEQEDFDGFGVLACEHCGYCLHPSLSGDVCDICGATIPPVEQIRRPIKNCKYGNAEDGCCLHPDNMTPECHDAACPLID